MTEFRMSAHKYNLLETLGVLQVILNSIDPNLVIQQQELPSKLRVLIRVNFCDTGQLDSFLAIAEKQKITQMLGASPAFCVLTT